MRNALVSVLCTALLGLCSDALVAQRGAGPAPAPAVQTPAGREASPASQRPPQTKTPQSFPRDQVEAGRTQFVSQCGFCHGRDAAGGAGGPDLTRSVLVAEDVRGDRLGPLIRSGRPDRGMPAFPLSDGELASLVAFIHDQKLQADVSSGGRRSVDGTDLESGDAVAGKRYFEAACVRCHSATGDLAGVATRHQGLTLLQRMLYPSAAGRSSSSRAPQVITVTLPSGPSITGRLAYRDEFMIAITDDAGWFRSWPASQVRFTIDDPLQAHVEQLGKYSDDDMHNVLAYLQTLR